MRIWDFTSRLMNHSFDVLIDEHFPRSPPMVALAQEDSNDMIQWDKINPGMRHNWHGDLSQYLHQDHYTTLGI
jgi:hypothetical protein